MRMFEYVFWSSLSKHSMMQTKKDNQDLRIAPRLARFENIKPPKAAEM